MKKKFFSYALGWLNSEFGTWTRDMICSKCGKQAEHTSNYCPNCGKKMKPLEDE